VKLLVHLHLFYEDMLEQMFSYLNNLQDFHYDLFVSLVCRNNEIEKKIKYLQPNAKIIYVDNKGFDVYPFIVVLNTVDIDEYNYVIKIHTKRNLDKAVVLHGKYYIASGGYWREKLLCFLESKDNFKTAIELLHNEDVGMVSHYKLIDDEIGECNESRALNLLNEIGLTLNKKRFVMGTMFVCKAELLKPLKRLHYEFEVIDSMNVKNTTKDGLLAHVYERLFGWIIYSQNKKIVPLYYPNIKERIVNFIMVKILKYKKYIVK